MKPRGWVVYSPEWGYVTGRRMAPDGHWRYEFGTAEQSWVFETDTAARRMAENMHPLYAGIMWGPR